MLAHLPDHELELRLTSLERLAAHVDVRDMPAVRRCLERLRDEQARRDVVALAGHVHLCREEE